MVKHSHTTCHTIPVHVRALVHCNPLIKTIAGAEGHSVKC